MSEIPASHALVLMEHYWKGIRSQVLRRLLTIWFAVVYSAKHNLHQELARRCSEKDLPANYVNMMYSLRAEDVMEVLGVSERTAYDYLRTLRMMTL